MSEKSGIIDRRRAAGPPMISLPSPFLLVYVLFSGKRHAAAGEGKPFSI